jgi:hypothetical protein
MHANMNMQHGDKGIHSIHGPFYSTGKPNRCSHLVFTGVHAPIHGGEIMTTTPPKFGTQALQEYDDLFDLKEYICADCRQPFQTSRHSLRCAMCQSLRQGQVGPATVICPGCDREHRIPVLAPHRLCPSCAADLDATERHIKETLAAAELRFQNAIDAWTAAYAQADPCDQERYHVVEEARAANAPGFAAKYQKALMKGDGLSALLKAKEACDGVATQVQGRLTAWAEQALEEVRAAR